jgi:hypothetical protein
MCPASVAGKIINISLPLSGGGNHKGPIISALPTITPGILCG